MKFNIGIFIDYKALDISKILRHKYEDYEYEYDDYVFSRSDIGWEAWKRARHEAEGLYLNHEEYIFDKKMNEVIDSWVLQKLANPKDLKKMNFEDKVAQLIFNKVKYYLSEE